MSSQVNISLTPQAIAASSMAFFSSPRRYDSTSVSLHDITFMIVSSPLDLTAFHLSFSLSDLPSIIRAKASNANALNTDLVPAALTNSLLFASSTHIANLTRRIAAWFALRLGIRARKRQLSRVTSAVCFVCGGSRLHHQGGGEADDTSDGADGFHFVLPAKRLLSMDSWARVAD
jgi:hypothetical protein